MELTIDNIKFLEKEIFPDLEFIGNDIHSMKHSRGKNPWVLFAPHFYAQKPAILTDSLIEKLKADGNILSIGSGPAYLEQFLVKAYDIPVQKIVLSDIDSLNVPDNFQFFKFDMHAKWPDMNQRFDYIIFPESVFFGISALSDGIRKYNPQVKIPMLKHLIEESLDRLKPYGELRMKSILPKPESMTTLVKEMTKDYKLSMYYCKTDFLLIKKAFSINS